MKKIILYITIGLLFLMHGVGLYGLACGDKEFAIKIVNLTSVNLMITALCLLMNIKEFYFNYLLAFVVIALAGFFVEVAGVETGLIFGEYTYGETMGTKFMDVPFVIGINWAVLILSCASIVNNRYSGILFKSLIGACLMVLMDFLLEPVAIQSKYWAWKSNVIPIQNYLAWFLISFLMFLFVFKFVKKIQNDSGVWVYIVQLLFLSYLNFTS